MGNHVATEVIKLMMRKDLKVIDSKVLILGFTFKEACLPKVGLPSAGRPARRRRDCPDVRNTRVIDIYNELRLFDMDVCIYDHWADAAAVKHEFGIDIINGGAKPVMEDYSAIILAVGHQEFKTWDIRKSDQQVVYDVKGVLSRELVDARL
jgi:UDP-N-acetyl-D-galactosamine dehydrogenase